MQLSKIKMNNRGQTLNLIGGTVIAFMVLIFVIFGVLFGISQLKPSSFFTASSAEANATTDLTANLTTGVARFGGYIPTIFLTLAVVVVLAAIAILILYVRRFSGGGTGGL